MTLNELYLKGKEILKNANITDYTFDTLCLIEHCFKLKRHELSKFRNIEVPCEKENEFFFFINERKNNRPLQYILGYWYFMGRKFRVQEGILIPRDDTEVLVNIAANLLRNKKKTRVLDLCSGTGIIAITLAKILDESKIFAADLSDIALEVLKENIVLNKADNVEVKKIDVLDANSFKEFASIDLIVSNPPYIPSGDIKTLQKELQFEPRLALDGGTDGLDFYRTITKNFKKSLVPGGKICFEVGINQAEMVKCILESDGFSDVSVAKDINKIDRVVWGTLMECPN